MAGISAFIGGIPIGIWLLAAALAIGVMWIRRKWAAAASFFTVAGIAVLAVAFVGTLSISSDYYRSEGRQVVRAAVPVEIQLAALDGVTWLASWQDGEVGAHYAFAVPGGPAGPRRVDLAWSGDTEVSETAGPPSMRVEGELVYAGVGSRGFWRWSSAAVVYRPEEPLWSRASRVVFTVPAGGHLPDTLPSSVTPMPLEAANFFDLVSWLESGDAGLQ